MARTGGRLRGETAVRHRGRDRSRGRKDVRHCGRERSSRNHRNGPQSRAKTQTHMFGVEHAAGLQKNEAAANTNHTAPAMTYGRLPGAVNGQPQMRQWYGAHHGSKNHNQHRMIGREIRLQRVLSDIWCVQITGIGYAYSCRRRRIISSCSRGCLRNNKCGSRNWYMQSRL